MKYAAVFLVLAGCAQHHVCTIPGLDEGVPAGSYRWTASATGDTCFTSHSAVFELDTTVIPLECEPVDECGGEAMFRCGPLLYAADLRWDGSSLVGTAVITRHDADGHVVCSAEVDVVAEAL